MNGLLKLIFVVGGLAISWAVIGLPVIAFYKAVWWTLFVWKF